MVGVAVKGFRCLLISKLRTVAARSVAAPPLRELHDHPRRVAQRLLIEVGETQNDFSQPIDLIEKSIETHEWQA
jgi:hypothetical protein